MRKFFLISIAISITFVMFGQDKTVLKPGDLAPPLPVYKWLKGNPIRKFEKGNIYVIEFGSTWCSPCKAMIPVLSELQSRYQNQISVCSMYVMEQNDNKDLSGEPTYLPKLKKYIEKQEAQMNYSIGVDDPHATLRQTWLVSAGKTGIPYTFIIDRDSRIAWIGSNPEILRQKLDEVITGKFLFPENNSEQLLTEPTHSKMKLVVSSTLTHFDPQQENPEYILYIQSYITPFMDDESSKLVGTVKTLGQSLSRLYYLAYSDTLWNQVLTRSPQTKEFPDTTRLRHAKRSYGKYYHKPIVLTKSDELSALFNYDLKFGKPVSAKILQNKLRSDLQNTFNFQVSLETRSVPCWILTLESLEKLQKIKCNTQDGKFDIVNNGDETYTFSNADMRDIIWMLGTNYGFLEFDYKRMKEQDQGIFLDKTNIKWKFNFIFSKTITFEKFQAYLQTIGLKLSKGNSNMKAIVINDPVKL